MKSVLLVFLFIWGVTILPLKANEITPPVVRDTLTPKKKITIDINKPTWTELSTAHKENLAPLASEWDSFSSNRKQKWLTISEKFPTMTPEEKSRIQKKMLEWVKLSPEERRAVRENFSKSGKMSSSEKFSHWEEYQHLSEEDKKKLSQQTSTKKKIANLPSHKASQAKNTPALPNFSTKKQKNSSTNNFSSPHEPSTPNSAP